MTTKNPPQDDDQGSAQKHIDPVIQKAIPTGKQVHDALMAPIDEDLMTESLPNLDAKYAGETPKDRAQRIERYKTSLKKYDAAFADWVSGVDERVGKYKQDVLTHTEAKSAEKDEGEISRLETELSETKEDE